MKDMKLDGAELINEDGTRAEYLDARARDLAIASSKGAAEALPEGCRDAYLEGYIDGFVEIYTEVVLDTLVPLVGDGVLAAEEAAVRASVPEDVIRRRIGKR